MSILRWLAKSQFNIIEAVGGGAISLLLLNGKWQAALGVFAACLVASVVVRISTDEAE